MRDRLEEKFCEDLYFKAVLQGHELQRLVDIEVVIEETLNCGGAAEQFGVLEDCIDWGEQHQLHSLRRCLDVLMRTHIDCVYEQVEDRLEHYKTLHRIFQPEIVYRFCLYIDDVAEPV